MGYKRRSLIFGNNITKKGFALPTILISSVIMLTVLLVSVSSTTAIRSAILTQYYSQLAQVAGDAGVAYAQACLAQNGNVPLWSDAKPLTPATDCSGNSSAAPAMNTLVVAGGGSGGGSTGGGGGGGGVLSSTNAPVSVTSYPVVVGAGGAIPGNQAIGKNGGNSSFNGLTAIGGGGGGYSAGGTSGAGGLSGGSGGGGQNYYGSFASGAGTAGQGYAGGPLGTTAASGGGGAGGAGFAGSGAAAGGNGGIGIISTITGANVYYSGGGGGASGTGAVVSGGLGGGGSAITSVGLNGDPNSGGGGAGGWAYAGGNGGAGGSGVVIVSYPTGSVTSNVTGAGNSCAQSGGNTVCKFVASGSFNVTAVSPAITCPTDSRCYVMTNGNVRSSFKVGLPTLDANGKASKISNTGYVEVLRTSTGDVWRTYNQPSVQSAVVPDFCSGTATSALGWNNAVKQKALASVLVVAGGGGGGSRHGGGGGAGGLIYSSVSLDTGAYPIAVGAGGGGTADGAVANENNASVGSNSTAFGLIALGGGSGNGAQNGTAGGSGGGGGANFRGAAGITGQGNSGGNGLYSTYYMGSGGGGAGGVGSSASYPSNPEPAGGAGLSYSITGSSVTYATGGKGASYNLNTVASAGAASTGNGGGAGGGETNGGAAGGSGIVVISYPTGSITATGGIISTSGGNTIHKFISNGTFTISSVQAVQPGGVGFPDSPALPIGISSGPVMPGSMYLRKDFTVSEAGNYTFKLLSGDDAYGYIDGKIVASSASSLGTGSVSLSAGCHTILTKLTNGGLQSSSAYILASLTKLDASAPMVVSDTSWRVTAGTSKHFSQVGYYADPGAWTPVRDYQDANSMASTWTATSGVSARAISTTHTFTTPYNYPATSYTYFRDPSIITVASPTNVSVTYVCDDGCNIYLDGQVIATGIGVVASTTVTLTEGQHKFAMSEFNNAAGLAEVALSVVKISDGSVLTFTNSGWTAAGFWETSLNNYYSYDDNFNPNPGTIPTTTINLLVVGGGGGGGSDMGGGGGGGGVVSNSAYTVSSNSYAVTVGAGGPGAAAGVSQAHGQNGSFSQFDNVVAFGGGGGGSEYSTNSSPPSSGASGGGSAGCTQNSVGSGIFGQGYRGGLTPGCYYPTGGGGAGGYGLASPGNGGVGITNNILGPNYYWGGGGGGAGYSNIAGNGGLGGGGGGGPKVSGGGLGGGSALNSGSDATVGVLVSQTNVPGGNAGANTGGGGGGGAHYNSNNYGGNGGSGIVVISFPTVSMTANANGVACPTSGANTICTFTSSGTFNVLSIP